MIIAFTLEQFQRYVNEIASRGETSKEYLNNLLTLRELADNYKINDERWIHVNGK